MHGMPEHSMSRYQQPLNFDCYTYVDRLGVLIIHAYDHTTEEFKDDTYTTKRGNTFNNLNLFEYLNLKLMGSGIKLGEYETYKFYPRSAAISKSVPFESSKVNALLHISKEHDYKSADLVLLYKLERKPTAIYMVCKSNVYCLKNCQDVKHGYTAEYQYSVHNDNLFITEKS